MCVRACVCVCMCVYTCIYTAETNLGVCENMTTTKTMAQRVDDDWVCMCCALRWWWRWRMDWLGVVWVCVCACIKLLLLLLLPDLYSLVVVAAISRTHQAHSLARNQHTCTRTNEAKANCLYNTRRGIHMQNGHTTGVLQRATQHNLLPVRFAQFRSQWNSRLGAHTHTRGGGRTVHRHWRAPTKWKKQEFAFVLFLLQFGEAPSVEKTACDLPRTDTDDECERKR